MSEPAARPSSSPDEVPPEMLLIIDPARIRKHREDRRMGSRLVAGRIGCSHSQICNYELGVTSEIRPEWAAKLAALLDLPLEDVFRALPGFALPTVESRISTDVTDRVSA